MSAFLVPLGAVSGAMLIVLLAASVLSRTYRIWPTPGAGSWQSATFWCLFRTLNGAAIASAVLLWSTLDSPGTALGFPPEARLAALATVGGILALYFWALLALGRSNTYCGREGLTTRGMYRWSRNPQYATIIPLYLAMAIAADDWATHGLVLALVTVYWLMARAEEPWLHAGYGAAYRSYCASVPRFFNWRRARTLAVTLWRGLMSSRPAALGSR